MGAGVYLAVFVSFATLWVAFDAQAFDWSGNSFCDRGWKWVVGCLFLFVVAFPAYLWQRRGVPRVGPGGAAPALASGGDSAGLGLQRVQGFVPQAYGAPSSAVHATASDTRPAVPVDLFSAPLPQAPWQQTLELHSQAADLSAGSSSTGASLVLAVAAGAAVALVGGLVWAGVVIATRFDFGFLAWGIGAATGFVVARIAGRPLTTPAKITAGVLAVVGIMVGKYVIFVHDVKTVVGAYLAQRGVSIGYLDTRQVSIFVHHFGSFVSPLYGVWALLALIAAVRVAGRASRPPVRL